MQRACSWRKRKTRVSRAPYRGMHLLSHCRAPARECSRRPPTRPATALLPQPLPLPPPLAPGAEQEPKASASARPASAGRAGSASSLGDGVAPRGSSPAAAPRSTAAGPVPAPSSSSWVFTREIGMLEGPRGKAMRRPSCRGERRAQGDLSSPEFGLCCLKEIGLGEGEGREAASCGMGPQAPQSASPDHWPGPGGRQVWCNEKTLSGCVIRLRCRWRELAGRLYLSASVAHSDTETAGQRSLRFFKNRFRIGGRTLLNLVP
ncbi:uncharacterized protein LOC141570579 isoform X2 [Rhinolophus sinicus]|uniref:uncharacterized protein LOC141570579 isoform X2 n=1 Tax=Rhinolophus sinicus TaxID=89399 RepID=UPI003D79010F